MITTISSFNPSRSATASNLLAYHPRYVDHHTSGLAGLFVNLEGVFPCLVGTPEYHPVCKLFTYEEDGFRNGRAVIDAADIGNNFNVFTGGNRATFGFAFTGCPTFTNDCFPTSTQQLQHCMPAPKRQVWLTSRSQHSTPQYIRLALLIQSCMHLI